MSTLRSRVSGFGAVAVNLYEATELFEGFEWTFAKTMAGIPHSYIVRKQCESERQFEYMVQYIRDHGVQERWRHYNHHYLYLSGYKYWTMSDTVERTLVINRARPDRPTAYDEIAETYDSLFYKKPYQDENRALFKYIRPRGRILDIGCGTGLAVEWIKDLQPRDYMGIDPSKDMIQQFGWKHPEYAPSLRCCSFDECWSRGFDTIIALYGVGSYISNVERVYDMLNLGGRAFIMYYAEDYEPVTYKALGGRPTDTFSLPQSENVIRFQNYLIERIVK